MRCGGRDRRSQACGGPQRRTAVLGEGPPRAQERSLQEEDRRGGARQQAGVAIVYALLSSGGPATTGRLGRGREEPATPTNVHAARGASRDKKIWAERRGPEPSAAVKDAFGAAYKRDTAMGRRAEADFIRASGSEPFLHAKAEDMMAPETFAKPQQTS